MTIGCFGDGKKLYIRNNSVLQFGNSVIQANWKQIASNVRKISLGANSIAYVSKNNELFVASDFLGFKDEESGEVIAVKEWTKVSNNLFSDGVKDTGFVGNALFVLSLSGKISVCNKDLSEFGEAESGISSFNSDGESVVAVQGSKILTWGQGISGLGDISTIIGNEEILNIYSRGWSHGTLIRVLTNSGGDYGWRYSDTYAGSYVVPKNWGKSNLEYPFVAEDEYPISYAGSRWAGVTLTNKGNLYGIGISDYIGYHVDNGDTVTIPVLLMSDVIQVTSGNDFFVAIKSDGTVWGTGKNTNGCLGRWIGVGRNSANSRYQSALTWVECPDLEL